MDNIILGPSAKRDVDKLIDNLKNADEKEVDKLLDNYHKSDAPAWHRFLKGAFNNPVDWWIGIIQLQMQVGMWGEKRRRQSQVIANELGQIIHYIAFDDKNNIPGRAINYCLKFKKADMVGRLAGGGFTTYASSGGKMGRKKLGIKSNVAIMLTNFTLASYGACVKTLGKGHKKPEHIMHAILTGRPDAPIPYPNIGKNTTKEEQQFLDKLNSTVNEMNRLSNVTATPTPISTFCAKPENKDLKGLCK